MDKHDMKPGLSLGYAPGQRGAHGGGSLQLGVNQESGIIHMTLPEGSPAQNVMQLSSMHVHGHSEGMLISPIAQPASQNSLPLQLLNHGVESSMNSSADGNLPSPSVGSKHGFSPLGNGGGPVLKKRKESNFRTGGGESSFRSPASHLQSVCSTPPMSPHRLMAPQATSQGAFQSVQPSSQIISDGQAPQLAFKKAMTVLQGSHQNLAQATFHQDHSQSNGQGDPRRLSVHSWGNQPLSVVDPDVWDLMEKEKNRQWRGIELIASENFVSQAVIEALGSHLTNKYSEGMPFARYYGGNEHIDQIETLCCERALEAFHLDREMWGVNVQPYSCTSANFAVYTALLQPKDRIMGLDSRSGGHLSHGYYTSSGRKVSVASNFFESFPYKVHPNTGYIDYDKLEEKAMDYRPKILICGGSAYPREWDFARFRQIADKCGAVLMCDMAHISGLVATQECNNPFEYCDVVTSTTHKILRGPRGGIIFYRKGPKPRRRGFSLYGGEESSQYDFEDKINFAVFPQLQGGPHNNVIAALAVALLQVKSPEYKAYIQQVKKNAARLAAALMRKGCRLVTDGTDNHLILWDLRRFGRFGLTGNLYEKVCEACNLTLNKNAVFGDSGAFAPGGVRLGTPAMTSRGCVEEDFEVIAEFLFKAAQISHNILTEHGKLQKDFMKGLENNKDIQDLKQAVENFARNLDMPGFDLSTMKYKH